jgi:flagellar hook-basal body complex protein FliE
MAININNIGNISTKDLLKNDNKISNNESGLNFSDMLKKEIDSTNQTMQNAQKAETDIATGLVKDLAKANIAIEKADLQMQMMLEVRNKAISAYKELSKIQV